METGACHSASGKTHLAVRGQGALIIMLLLIGAGLTGCGSTAPPPTAGSAPTIASFTVDPATITSGASTSLSWMVSGATSIAITPGAFTSTSETDSKSVSPTATTTYTLTATNANGSATATAKVTVNPPSKPVINSFTASPTSINSGSSSTLTWTSTGATTLAITPGTFTSTSANDSTSVSPTATTTYTLTASNADGFHHGHRNRHHQSTQQTRHQLFYREPGQYYVRRPQHARLDHHRSDEPCHHSRHLHVDIRNRLDQCEPHHDDDLYADRHEYRGLDHSHCQGDGNGFRRATGDHDHFLPRRNPGRCVHRLHHRRHRRNSALHFFG